MRQTFALVSALLVTVSLAAILHGQTAQPPSRQPLQPAPAGRGRGDPFAGQPRVKALVVSGGCCHDYSGEAKVLMDTIGKALPVDWTVAIQGGRGTTGNISLYNNADWAKGFDIVVHNECFADVTDPQYLRKITAAHRGGVPAMVIHCSMHSYRAATVDDWREFLGVTSRKHDHQSAYAVRVLDKNHSITRELPEKWVTPMDELYVIEKLWPNAKALATAVSPEDQTEYPLVWVNEYGGKTRVFGTTLGHGNDTWNDPVYQDLLTRGFKWALRRE